MPCPLNEFSEQMTGDFGTKDKPGGDDTMLYYLANPEKSQFPDSAKRQAEWWNKRKDTHG